ncbi:hypothetical protein [Bradyrhizobium erythrophlei]|uniref:Uncharacterized protein n=1 Tax=Bradyrhizobium erythrophlei TaxID=1437360 RepID=A0A1M5NIZ9_9BRAD|nr:hypothetical protein [Bradyrhizobium erythrophlei]SHG89536.1 hypothetical protein SAMN05443248_3016 [Bradyrhizobium erythrophlei]
MATKTTAISKRRIDNVEQALLKNNFYKKCCPKTHSKTHIRKVIADQLRLADCRNVWENAHCVASALC